MSRVQEIMQIMGDLKARSGKNYAVQVSKGVAQLVILSKEGRKTVVTPVEGACGPNVYTIADKLER